MESIAEFPTFLAVLFAVSVQDVVILSCIHQRSNDKQENRTLDLWLFCTQMLNWRSPFLAAVIMNLIYYNDPWHILYLISRGKDQVVLREPAVTVP